MGSDESRFTVSLIASDSHTTVSTNHNLFEEKESRSLVLFCCFTSTETVWLITDGLELKQNQTEVPLLTSLTNALPLGQTRSQEMLSVCSKKKKKKKKKTHSVQSKWPNVDNFSKTRALFLSPATDNHERSLDPVIACFDRPLSQTSVKQAQLYNILTLT